jgi:hypothetical protein
MKKQSVPVLDSIKKELAQEKTLKQELIPEKTHQMDVDLASEAY